MRLSMPIVSLILAGVLAACGGEEPTVADRQPDSESPTAVETSTVDPTESATPEAPVYRILSRSALDRALIELEDLPPGYSQDPHSDDSGNKYFCDYKPPAEERSRVRRDFTKGGGMSAELVSFSLRQFGSVEDAKAAWTAMTKTLKKCRSEVYDGVQLTYSPMSAPKLGDGSSGVKIDADGTTLLQNFVLVGPTIVSAGGGGLTNADAGAIARLLEIQVKRYLVAATK